MNNLQEPPSLEKAWHVLIVDPQQVNITHYTRCLTGSVEYQFTVGSARSLAQASRYLQDHSAPDCILLDEAVATDGGCELLLKELEARQYQSAVVMMGQGTDDEALQSLFLGVDDYVNFRAMPSTDLVRSIRYTIQRSRKRRSTVEEVERNASQLRAQRDILSVVTHEFRTPLAVIDSSVQLIDRYVKRGHMDIDKHLQKIRRSVSRMLKMIDRSMDLARVEQGDIAAEFSRVDVLVLIDQEVERFRALYPGRTLQVRHDSNQPAFIQTDKRYCVQVLDNVLSNAIKFSDDTSHVHIEVLCNDTRVMVQVHDEGIGIPEGELANIGKKFYRAHNGKQVAGSGVGVYLVKAMMEVLNGSFNLHSEEGRGTIATLSFPKAIEGVN